MSLRAPNISETVIDAGLWVNPASEMEIVEYLPAGWREYLAGGYQAGVQIRRPFSIFPFPPYVNPMGEKLPDPTASAGVRLPASDLARTLDDHLEANGIERAIAFHDLALALPALPHPQLSIELTRACNRWVVDQVLTVDRRLYGTILATTQFPDIAAAEVELLAANERMVAVALTANALSRPFGHPSYEPIFEAAAAAGLPVVIMATADNSMEILTSPSAAGVPSLYSDYRAVASSPLMTHLSSLFGQGTFERHPELKVVLTGAGISWVPSFLWRMEADYKSFRIDAPWLTLGPIERFLSNFMVTTYPLDHADSPEALAKYLGAQPGLEDVVCYMSAYPNSDRDTVADVKSWLPAGWHHKVLCLNAERTFRWRAGARAPR